MYVHRIQTHAHTNMCIGRQTDRHRDRQTDTETDRQTDTLRHRQKHRQTNRQTWMYYCLHALKLQCQLLSQVGALQCPNDRDKQHCVELYFETDINMIIK